MNRLPAVCALVLCSALGAKSAEAQVECQVLRDATKPRWTRKQTVYYSINVTITDPSERSQIEKAFQLWNSANQANGSGIHFVPAPNGVNPQYIFIT